MIVDLRLFSKNDLLNKVLLKFFFLLLFFNQGRSAAEDKKKKKKLFSLQIKTSCFIADLN